jgi:hypothetical protein
LDVLCEETDKSSPNPRSLYSATRKIKMAFNGMGKGMMSNIQVISQEIKISVSDNVDLMSFIRHPNGETGIWA